MRKKTFKELVNENKKIILEDRKSVEQIYKKIDDKHMQSQPQK